MAHKKSSGSAKNGRDSNPKYLGIKITDGQFVDAGGIIVRQRGTRIYPGIGTGLGKDHTIFAINPGIVHFNRMGKKGKRCVIEPVS